MKCILDADTFWDCFFAGGALLQNHYSTSLVDALSDLYPDHQWLPWKFQKAPRRYWDDAKHQRAFMEFLAYQELKLRDIKELKIQSLATYIKYGGMLFEQTEA
jgi:hypothetical protein